MKFVTHLVSLDFKADTATFHLPPGTRIGAGTYCIRLLSEPHADNGVELGLDLLRRARTHLPLAAMSWNESEDRTVAAFHAKDVLDLIQEIDAAIAAGPPESCRSTTELQEQPKSAGAAGAAAPAAHGTCQLAQVGNSSDDFEAELAALIVRDCTEFEQADPDEISTICINVTGLSGIVRSRLQRAAKSHPRAKPTAWQPQFDVMSPKQEDLVKEFCAEIAGPKGQPGRPPDPVRLLEMAEALYKAEREECGP